MWCKLFYSCLFAGIVLLSSTANAQSRKSGYYKDVFMDSGIMLTSREDLPAVRFLDLTMERLSTQENKDTNAVTAYDRAIQKQKIVGNELDENGILLYPDGEPRFRVYYSNGGKATTHGRSLTPEGLENIRTFFANGGSFVGTCAGAFISSKGTTKDGEGINNHAYLGIYEGYTNTTRLYEAHTSLSVEKKSPLLKYYDFGGDMQIDSVRHNGGCFLPDEMPAGTEILLRYDCDTLNHTPDLRNKVNAWAYKPSETSGRAVLSGSHPEGVESGDRLEMFAGMLRYAMDGNGGPALKAVLADGEAREMTLFTHDGDPTHTRIGDRQYHHFAIDIPKKAAAVTLTLQSCKNWTDYDLYLFASYDGFAYNDTSKYHDITKGIDKTITIENPKAGKLYISVYCDTTVDTVDTIYGEQYSGRVDVLNGVPYIIKAEITK